MIVAAAFRYRLYDGTVVILSKPQPARHNHLLVACVAMNWIVPADPNDQGFINDQGQFRTRREAYREAIAAGQRLLRISDGYNGDELYSEDLW